jgi:hypothetical protein
MDTPKRFAADPVVMESPLHIEALVKGAFSPQELASLNRQSAFTAACVAAKGTDDFVNVCEIGERLLADRNHDAALTPLPAHNNL